MLDNTWLKKQSHDTRTCRDLGHAWAPSTASRIPKGYLRSLVCDRCGALKTQRLDNEGYIKSTSMAYPAEYLLPKGAGRLTRSDRAALRIHGLGS